MDTELEQSNYMARELMIEQAVRKFLPMFTRELFPGNEELRAAAYQCECEGTRDSAMQLANIAHALDAGNPLTSFISLLSFCKQCGHSECKPMSGGTVCALCYEGYNCAVAERESKRLQSVTA